MAMKQQLKQSLNMTMTPQLQQAIKILQMSSMELTQEINNALVENPVLEETADEPMEDDRYELEAQRESEDSAERMENAIEKLGGEQDDFDWESYLEQSSQYQASSSSSKTLSSEDLPSFEQILSRPQTLYDHVLWQLRMSVNSRGQLSEAEAERTFAIGEEIIGNLNDDGYLTVLVEELADRMSVDVSEIEAVLYLIQRFDPPGVAARNLQECLLIQCEMLGYSDLCEAIVEKCLPALETKNYQLISKTLAVDFAEVVEAAKLIHALEPKPGRIFLSSDPHYIVPDVFVVKSGTEFVVAMNDDGMPRLRISRTYQQQLQAGMLKGAAKSYVREKLKGAVWLMRSIVQRQKSIFRVTESIVKRQREFFEKGPAFLRPMVLKDIAEELELHESTVSRVTTNKYVHTSYGVFELKYFFNSAISSSVGGEDIASESVRLKIRELIGAENAQHPLSDQQIVAMLEEQEIRVARRTVAKYREAMGILPSSKRKKFN